MPTRLLPARWFGPRVIPPRLDGGSSAAVVQTATHLALTTQPGGAVSGVPLTIQPAGEALDALDALVTDFGGTITANVSSGPATISAGGSVVASGGGFAFTGLTLTLTGPPGLVTITLSSGSLTPVTSVAFMLAATPSSVFTLVDAPTRLGKMRWSAKTGDTLVMANTLMGYAGSTLVAQDLPPGTTVVFNLRGPDGTLLVNRRPATVLQSGAGDAATNKGRVSVSVLPAVNIPEGISTFEFEATFPDTSVVSYPDDANGELKVIKELG